MRGRSFLSWAKKMVPKISNTERVALESGAASIESAYFRGEWIKPCALADQFPLPMFRKEKKYLWKGVERHCAEIIRDHEIFQEKKIPTYVYEDLKQMGLFGMIVPEQFGGLQLNHHEQSQIVTYIASASQPVGVVVMVPNSLGPSELLVKYGTSEQKEKYLPSLASGEQLPCFGLTGPHSGSDAASMPDTGVLEADGETITLNVNKRYITLAPIADLVGVAFHLKDPYHNLTKGKTGITIAILPRSLFQGGRHNPMDVPFPNGTLVANDVKIKIQDVLGGEPMAGQGWKMLMECLAVGRGISLPACATASSKLATLYTSLYSQYRVQFRIPIGRMQGVQEKLAIMGTETFKITCMQSLMNSILDAGHQPPVLTAMMKYETTERSRRVVNQGMDVVAGAGICKGPRNILANVYQAIPIGITVEGSNTLTRSLIIFGQGMMKCNPTLYEMVTLLEKKELSVQESTRFYSLFFHTLSTTFKNLGNGLLNPFLSRTERYTAQVSVTSLVLLFLGKGLKSDQMLTGKMSDILGSLFAIQAMEWYVEHEEKQANNPRVALFKEIKSMAIREESLRIETALRGIRDNFPLLFLRYTVLYPLLTFAIPTSPTSHEEIQRLATILTFDANAKEIRSWLSQSIHVPVSIQNMKEWVDFPESHPERKKIADEIVAVDVTGDVMGEK